MANVQAAFPPRDADGDPSPGADPFANKTKVLLVISIGVFMAALDGSRVNLSLPTIARDFHVDATAAATIVSSYLIAIAAICAVGIATSAIRSGGPAPQATSGAPPGTQLPGK